MYEDARHSLLHQFQRPFHFLWRGLVKALIALRIPAILIRACWKEVHEDSRDKAWNRVNNGVGDRVKEGFTKGWAGDIDFAATNQRPHFIAQLGCLASAALAKYQKLAKSSEFS